MALDPQLQTLHLYTALSALREDWPGSLILSIGLGPEGCALAFAALTAGAAILTQEESPALCRAAMRSGACDFVVNTVDEALRVLKNEIRQRKPLSVALELSPETALTELRGRGILPQLFADPSHTHQPLGPEAGDLLSRTQEIAQAKDWHEQAFSFESSAALHAFDTRLQTVIPQRDPRHRWLTSAPRLFRRDRTRHLFLTPAEFRTLSGGPSFTVSP